MARAALSSPRRSAANARSNAASRVMSIAILYAARICSHLERLPTAEGGRAPWPVKRSACTHQFAQIMREYLRPLPVRHVEAQATLWIEDVCARRVVHRVAAGRRTGHLLVNDLEFLRRAR